MFLVRPIMVLDVGSDRYSVVHIPPRLPRLLSREWPLDGDDVPVKSIINGSLACCSQDERAVQKHVISVVHMFRLIFQNTSYDGSNVC